MIKSLVRCDPRQGSVSRDRILKSRRTESWRLGPKRLQRPDLQQYSFIIAGSVPGAGSCTCSGWAIGPGGAVDCEET